MRYSTAGRSRSTTESVQAAGTGKRTLRFALTTLIVFAILLGAFLLVPFDYRATAVISVDPVQATDAEPVALQDVVQAVESEGFLLNVLEALDVSADLAVAGPDEPQEGVGRFRDNISVSQSEPENSFDITYSADDPAHAAKYANAIAEALQGAETGSSFLPRRLKELRERALESEQAAAEFERKNLPPGAASGVGPSQQEVAILGQQIAMARTRTAEAEVQYESQAAGFAQQNGSTAGSSPISSELALLQRDRKRLSRELAALQRTHGERHPTLSRLRDDIRILDRQIADEREIFVSSLQKSYENALKEQTDLEETLARLIEASNRTEDAQTELAELERQATADRAAYEQFLARFNAANDQNSLLETNSIRIVSSAQQPLTTTRPNLALTSFALLFAAFFITLVSTLTDKRLSTRNLARIATDGASAPAIDDRLASPSPVASGKSGYDEMLGRMDREVRALNTIIHSMEANALSGRRKGHGEPAPNTTGVSGDAFPVDRMYDEIAHELRIVYDLLRFADLPGDSAGRQPRTPSGLPSDRQGGFRPPKRGTRAA